MKDSSNSNSEFSSDFIASIDKVLAISKPTQPLDQLCFVWVKSKTGPRLVCFRKFKTENEEEFEMMVWRMDSL